MSESDSHPIIDHIALNAAPPKAGNVRKLKKQQKEAEQILIKDEEKKKKILQDRVDGVIQIVDEIDEKEENVVYISRREKKRLRDLELAGRIEISLCINCTPYEYGVMCTFCESKSAVVNCPECDDFFCQDCDMKNHDVKKRKHHIRSNLSLLTLDAASKICTYAVRYHGHLRSLQFKCRKKFKRYLDSSIIPLSDNKNTPAAYYYNSIYGSTSWVKPYCLRRTELKPFISREQAASLIQGLHRMFIGRQLTIIELKKQYSKIFDRMKGKYYYAFNGKSTLIPRQKWKKPFQLGKRGYRILDLDILYTIDISAIRIQNKWRSVLVRRFLISLTRATYTKEWDPFRGDFGYYTKETSEHFKDDKPLMLGSEDWLPNFVPDWSLYKVSVFLRRIGLKQYVDIFHKYGVDGKVLLKLDEEDFDNLNVTSSIHMKKIVVELDRLFPLRDRVELEEDEHHYIKRERMRNEKRKDYAACMIQKAFREFQGRRSIEKFKMVIRVTNSCQALAGRVVASNGWWTDKDIPSKNMDIMSYISENKEDFSKKGHNHELLSKEKEIVPKKSDKNEGKKKTNRRDSTKSVGSIKSFGSAITSESRLSSRSRKSQVDIVADNIAHNTKGLEVMNNIVKYIGVDVCENGKPLPQLKLPAIKSFGRKSDHLSVKGWGKYTDGGKWNCFDSDNMYRNNDSNNGDIDGSVFSIIDDTTHNPTRLLTNKLHASGYDKRRLETFLRDRMN